MVKGLIIEPPLYLWVYNNIIKEVTPTFTVIFKELVVRTTTTKVLSRVARYHPGQRDKRAVSEIVAVQLLLLQIHSGDWAIRIMALVQPDFSLRF